MKQTKLKTGPDIAIADNEFRGSKNIVYSVKGGMLLACRIAMSNISARGIGKVLLRGTHHSTAASWEIKCRAAMNESARVFYQGMALDLYHHAVTDAPGWHLHCISTGVTPQTLMYGNPPNCTRQK